MIIDLICKCVPDESLEKYVEFCIRGNYIISSVLGRLLGPLASTKTLNRELWFSQLINNHTLKCKLIMGAADYGRQPSQNMHNVCILNCSFYRCVDI